MIPIFGAFVFVLSELWRSFWQQKRTQRCLVILGGDPSQYAMDTNGGCSRCLNRGCRTVVVWPCERVHHLMPNRASI